LVDAHIGAVMDEIAKVHAAGKRLAVLVSGDPGLFSLAQSVVRRFGREQCEMISGVSSVQVAFARMGLDWADAHIISAHAATPDVTDDATGQMDKVAILAGSKDALRWAAHAARTAESSHAAVLCENLTLDDERIRLLTAAQLEATDAASLSVVLLIRRSLLA
jgi:cobalt-precorrin-7 (C5)-methyltransferase